MRLTTNKKRLLAVILISTILNWVASFFLNFYPSVGWESRLVALVSYLTIDFLVIFALVTLLILNVNVKKKILLVLAVILFSWVAANGFVAKIWYIQGVSIRDSGKVVMVDFSHGYTAGCGGASSCSSEQRYAVTRIFKILPVFWFMDVQISIEGTPEKGDAGYDA